MAIYATICGADMAPITEPVEIVDDDFEALEAEARSLSADCKCCIRWSRDSDGQTAYWSPSGACIKPHWYAKRGAPFQMAGAVRRNIFTDQQSWDIAQRIGNGNASLGIRLALAAYPGEKD